MFSVYTVCTEREEREREEGGREGGGERERRRERENFFKTLMVTQVDVP